jgi:hypothetical protein
VTRRTVRSMDKEFSQYLEASRLLVQCYIWKAQLYARAKVPGPGGVSSGIRPQAQLKPGSFFRQFPKLLR